MFMHLFGGKCAVALSLLLLFSAGVRAQGGNSTQPTPTPLPYGDPRPTPKPPPVPPRGLVAEPVAPAGWQRFSLGKDSFSVVLPKKPTEMSERKNLGNDFYLTVETYTVEADAGFYLLSRMPDLPIVSDKVSPSFVEGFYDGIWRGFAEGMRKELANKGLLFELKVGEPYESRLGGRQGRTQDFTLGPLTGRVKATVSGRQAFMVLVMWMKDMPVNERDIVFDSFRLSQPGATIK